MIERKREGIKDEDKEKDDWEDEIMRARKDSTAMQAAL